MKSRIQKWGNSLALRIPKVIAEEVHLERNTEVEVSLEQGKLVVVPMTKKKWTLEALLAGINDHNIHSEVETGSSMGNEVW